MFEKFTHDARRAVVEAQAAAHEAGAREISAQAVFAGLARIENGEAVRLLRNLGVSREDVFAELARVRRRGGISDADAEALTEFGIDVDQIVERIEQTHGPGALAQAKPAHAAESLAVHRGREERVAGKRAGGA